LKRFDQYINDVLSGKQVTGELIKLAVERHSNDLTKSWQYKFDYSVADRAIKFFELLRHWKGEWAGTPIHLEPHQVFYIGSLFGWLREDGTRRFRTSFKEVARKNGKTSEGAGKVLFHLLKDNEMGAQAYFVATKERQAKIGFDDSDGIISTTSDLGEYFKILRNSIICHPSKGFIQYLGSDSKKQDGFDPSWGVIDEYHAHKTDEMLNVLESGMGSRRQPMIDVITTAGFHKEYPCYSNLRRVSIDVLRGIKTDETLLALIFEMDKDDDWKDQSLWIKSNPNLGVSVKMDYMLTRFNQAINEGSTKEIDFKTKNLNIWTDSADTWIPDEVWMKGALALPDLTGRQCWGGLDLATKRDITSFVLMFPIDNKFYVKCWFFIPEAMVKSREEMDYRGWVNDGYLIQTPGDVTDYDYVKSVIRECMSKYSVQKIGYDDWNASQTVIDLGKEGVSMAPVRQGMKTMHPASVSLEDKAIEGNLIHAGHPVLRWMNSNVVLKFDPAGNFMMDKGSSMNKIDGMVFIAMGIHEYIHREEPASQPNIRVL